LLNRSDGSSLTSWYSCKYTQLRADPSLIPSNPNDHKQYAHLGPTKLEDRPIVAPEELVKIELGALEIPQGHCLWINEEGMLEEWKPEKAVADAVDKMITGTEINLSFQNSSVSGVDLEDEFLSANKDSDHKPNIQTYEKHSEMKTSKTG
jgi:hypothetical protein